jgi:3-phosphoshikimate 1-carboxyvinyltransferase
LKIKETDRIEALKKEMLKLGYVLHDTNGQELVWEGERLELQSSLPAIDTYEDHRMALAFAPAAFAHPVVINHPGVVSKSYPHFWDDLEHAGFLIDKEI